MNKAYNRINWQNQPSTATALGATNLNKIDIALNSIDDRVITLNTTKLDLTTANSMVKSFSLNQSTGVITITLLDGTVTTYDTKLEKLAVNFAYDATAQQLVITLDDGTKQYVDMSALITQYEFKDSSTIGFSVDSSGKVSASVKNGSITAEQLQPNYLADITTQQQTATAQAKLSKRYAVGGVETGDTTDNAKYYKEQAELFKTQAKQYRDETQDISNVGIAGESTLGLVKGNGNVAVQSDGSMWANPYKDVDTQTGTFITSTKADDALAQMDVLGTTLVTPTNPDLPISPDNIATLVSPLNFDLVSYGKNYIDKSKFIRNKVVNYSNGKIETLSSYFVTDYVRVEPLKTYNWQGSFATGQEKWYYDINKQPIKVMPTSKTFTTPVDCYYIVMSGLISNIDNNDFLLELGSTATTYTPYKEDRINIPLDLGEWNEIKDGQYVKGAEEITFNGTESDSLWIVVDGAYRRAIGFIINDNLATFDGSGANIMCTHFVSNSSSETTESEKDKYSIRTSASGNRIWFFVPLSVTLSNFKSMLSIQNSNGNPVKVRYRTNKQTSTPLNTYLKTFKGVTNIFTNATPQPELTVTFKAQLWADLYNHQKAIESKFDKNKVLNNDTATIPGFAWDAVRGAAARKDIDALMTAVNQLNSNFVDTITTYKTRFINYIVNPDKVITDYFSNVPELINVSYVGGAWISGHGQCTIIGQEFFDGSYGMQMSLSHTGLKTRYKSLSAWGEWQNNDLNTVNSLSAVSEYGVVSLGGYLKSGKQVTINLQVNIAKEVPALTAIVTGLPVCLVNLTALTGFKTSGSVLNGFYVAVDTIRCASILPVGNYTISGTYLTY